MPKPKLDLSKLDFVSEKEVGGHIYTLYHQDSGDHTKGFTHSYYIITDQDPTNFKQAVHQTTITPDTTDANGKHIPGSHTVKLPDWEALN